MFRGKGLELNINYGILFKHLNSEFIIELNTMLCCPVMKVEIWYLSVIYHHILNMVKNHRGDPWKSKIFLLRRVNETGWRAEGGQEPSKILHLFNQQN